MKWKVIKLECDKHTTVNLVVEIRPDGTPFHESVLVEELGENHYRVLATPGLLEGFAGGDEIELAPAERLGFRVTKRGGNVGVQFFWSGDMRHCKEELELKVRALGGHLDGEQGSLLVFTVPVRAGFPAIERIFSKAEMQYPGCRWMYANVYDPDHPDTQLNWWK